MAESTAWRHGLALYRAAKWDDAVEPLRRAVESEPGEVRPWQHLAAALWRSGRRRAAVGVLRDAVAAHPASADTWYELAAALAGCGKRALARFAVTEARHLDPDHPLAGDLAAELDGGADPVAELEATLALAQPPAGLRARLDELGILALGALRRAVEARGPNLPFLLAELGRLAPVAGRAAAAELAADPDPAARTAAVAVVVAGMASVPERYEAALARLAADPDPAVAAALGAALERVAAGPATVAARLLTALPAEAEAAREVVVARLASGEWASGDTAGEVFALLFADPSPTVRELAMSAAVTGGAEELLRQAYEEGDSTARRALLEGFIGLGATDLLTVALWDEDPTIRAETAQRLGEVGDEDGLAALRDKLDYERNPAVRTAMEAAAKAIEERTG